MREVRLPGPVVEAPFDDLTARARIREAALALFAERGIDRATIRDIARAAGVSGGLVRHHFGSKDHLRDACDSYALERLMGLKEQAVLEGKVANPAFLSTAHPSVLLLYRYLARSMLDGSAAAGAMFDEMVDLGERWFAQHNPGQFSDPRAVSALLIALELGALSMKEQLSRALAVDILSPGGHLRLLRAKIDLYSHPLLDPDFAAQARTAVDGLQAKA